MPYNTNSPQLRVKSESVVNIQKIYRCSKRVFPPSSSSSNWQNNLNLYSFSSLQLSAHHQDFLSLFSPFLLTMAALHVWSGKIQFCLRCFEILKQLFQVTEKVGLFLGIGALLNQPVPLLPVAPWCNFTDLHNECVGCALWGQLRQSSDTSHLLWQQLDGQWEHL